MRSKPKDEIGIVRDLTARVSRLESAVFHQREIIMRAIQDELDACNDPNVPQEYVDGLKQAVAIVETISTSH